MALDRASETLEPETFRTLDGLKELIENGQFLSSLHTYLKTDRRLSPNVTAPTRICQDFQTGVSRWLEFTLGTSAAKDMFDSESSFLRSVDINFATESSAIGRLGNVVTCTPINETYLFDRPSLKSRPIVKLPPVKAETQPKVPSAIKNISNLPARRNDLYSCIWATEVPTDPQQFNTYHAKQSTIASTVTHPVEASVQPPTINTRTKPILNVQAPSVPNQMPHPLATLNDDLISLEATEEPVRASDESGEDDLIELEPLVAKAFKSTGPGKFSTELADHFSSPKESKPAKVFSNATLLSLRNTGPTVLHSSFEARLQELGLRGGQLGYHESVGK